ncbi:MAG: ribose-phosphate pyrophosphokinase [Deltaproteobacteria bacterium]|nr:ribose-phosphate pyrophosphokinase [Deltaproteobacteria bacterium]
MSATLISGSAHPQLAEALARETGLPLGRCGLDRFPDGERHIQLACDVRGEVFIVQPLGNPVGEHVLELALIADACRRAGASRNIAVTPYLGYARQDRRTAPGEALGSQVLGRLVGSAPLDAIVVVDVHQPAVEGCFPFPMIQLTAADLLADAMKSMLPPNAVVVAPDLGAMKLAQRFADRLGLPAAIVHKARLGGAQVQARGVVGDVKGKVPVIIDDMITTGSTIEAAARAVEAHGAESGPLVGAVHGVFAGDALARLARLGVRGLAVTDSLPQTGDAAVARKVVPVAPLIATALKR